MGERESKVALERMGQSKGELKIEKKLQAGVKRMSEERHERTTKRCQREKI